WEAGRSPDSLSTTDPGRAKRRSRSATLFSTQLSDQPCPRPARICTGRGLYNTGRTGLAEVQAVLEDGLLDASALVRARAADAIGKAGLAGKSGPLRRALNDAMPAVRIAAMNALSEANVTEIRPYLIEVARTDDGPESVFASAALYRLGRQDMLTDITGAATLPDPE